MCLYVYIYKSIYVLSLWPLAAHGSLIRRYVCMFMCICMYIYMYIYVHRWRCWCWESAVLTGTLQQLTATYCNTQVAIQVRGVSSSHRHAATTHCNTLLRAATHCKTQVAMRLLGVSSSNRHAATTYCNTLQHAATHFNTQVAMRVLGVSNLSEINDATIVSAWQRLQQQPQPQLQQQQQLQQQPIDSAATKKAQGNLGVGIGDREEGGVSGVSGEGSVRNLRRGVWVADVLEATASKSPLLQCVAVCCSVLQCVTECGWLVWWRLLQVIFLRCGALQCVVVCCDVLRCVGG